MIISEHFKKLYNDCNLKKIIIMKSKIKVTTSMIILISAIMYTGVANSFSLGGITAAAARDAATAVARDGATAVARDGATAVARDGATAAARDGATAADKHGEIKKVVKEVVEKGAEKGIEQQQEECKKEKWRCNR
ncbi:MAG: hypothetical protein NTW85_02300 [Methylococcales bacterium]|nr:hypothetical protein [Methylococcales bacterium]